MFVRLNAVYKNKNPMFNNSKSSNLLGTDQLYRSKSYGKLELPHEYLVQNTDIRNSPSVKDLAETENKNFLTTFDQKLNTTKSLSIANLIKFRNKMKKKGDENSIKSNSDKSNSEESDVGISESNLEDIYNFILREIQVKGEKCGIYDKVYEEISKKILENPEVFKGTSINESIYEKLKEKFSENKWFIESENEKTLLTIAIANQKKSIVNQNTQYKEVGLYSILFLLFNFFENNRRDLVKELENFTDNSNRTLLHHAAKRGDAGFLKFVMDGLSSYELEKGVNSRDEIGQTPLHYSALSGSKECFKILIESGGKFSKSSNNKSELHYASESGNVDLLEYLKFRLIKNSLFESNKNQKDDDGNNALHYASLSGDKDSIKFLIDNNVLFTSNKYGENPLHKIAVRVEAYDANVLDYLKQELRSSGKLKNAINEQDENGNTPLHIAAQHGNKFLITKLMSLGASIDVKNNNKNTPLHTAIIYGHSYCVNVFFENSKDTVSEIVGIHGRDLVHLAAMYGKYDCLSFLFKKSPNYNINKVTDKGNTALHLVVSGDGNKALSRTEVESRQKCINLLIGEGCEMNSVNYQCDTPLHLAARFGDFDSLILEFIINKLQEKNINLNREFFHKNNDGDNVFHMAARSGNKSAFEKLFNSISLNSLDITKIVREKNYQSETLLHLAASSGNLECIRYVVDIMKERKININQQMQKLNTKGENLAHLIALSGEVECLDFIMGGSEIGLSIEYPFHRDKEDNSILHKAALQDKYGSYFFWLLLCSDKEEGFPFGKFLRHNDKNIYNITPLHVAAACLNCDSISYIIENSGVDNAYLLNCQSKFGRTPLHYVFLDPSNDKTDKVFMQHKDIILQRREENKVRKLEAITALMYKVENERKVVNGKINLDIKDNHGKTVLDYVIKNDVDVQKLFLSVLYELKKKSEHKYTIFKESSLKRHTLISRINSVIASVVSIMVTSLIISDMSNSPWKIGASVVAIICSVASIILSLCSWLWIEKKDKELSDKINYYDEKIQFIENEVGSSHITRTDYNTTEEINELLQRVAKLEVALMLKGKISSIDEVLRQSEEEGRTAALKRDSRQSYVGHSNSFVDKVKRISKKGFRLERKPAIHDELSPCPSMQDLNSFYMQENKNYEEVNALLDRSVPECKKSYSLFSMFSVGKGKISYHSELDIAVTSSTSKQEFASIPLDSQDDKIHRELPELKSKKSNSMFSSIFSLNKRKVSCRSESSEELLCDYPEIKIISPDEEDSSTRKFSNESSSLLLDSDAKDYLTVNINNEREPNSDEKGLKQKSHSYEFSPSAKRKPYSKIAIDEKSVMSKSHSYDH